MNADILHFGRNTTGGRDLICGDIHGHFTRLYAALEAVNFDGLKDRLFSVGDLVDRGPESHRAEVWLRQPWFHAVRGNHEEATVWWAGNEIDADSYRRSFGAGWNVDNTQEASTALASIFGALPIGIELETEAGLVGILHADCPVNSWDGLKAALADPGGRGRAAAEACVWSRDRHERMFDGPVAGVRAVVVGHTVVRLPTSLDNVIFIDTAGWGDGAFTLLDAATLRPAGSRSTLAWGGA